MLMLASPCVRISVTVLIWVDIFALFTIWMITTYLTNAWKIGFTHAAAIVNFFWGFVFMMPLALQFLVDALIGNYWMLLLSTFTYGTGLGMLSMSTPPEKSGVMGTCSEYKPECIVEGQKIPLYTALALTAFGMSGHLTSLGGFMGEQRRVSRTGNTDEGAFKEFFVVFLLPIIGATAIPLIKPWSVRFGIPALCAVVATLILLCGSCSYRHERPLGSPLTSVFRVFVASARKIFYRCPRDATELYEIERRDYCVYVVPHTRGHRFLDKAAIILPDQTLEEQERNRWTLCRVTEVEETKSLLRMIPICMTLVCLGVASSLLFTYFVEQADKLNRKVGHLSFPLPILLWFTSIGQSCFTFLYNKLEESLDKSGKRPYASPIGIAISMIIGILCCITAATVETRRLYVVKSHGLIDKPSDKIPMSMFWLFPQFILQGGLQGISQTSVMRLLSDQLHASLGSYSNCIAMCFSGVGNLGSVLSVYVVGVISERGGKPNWFQDTLNKSRLDNYYWTLAAITAVNLVVFILVAICYAYKDTRAGVEAPELEPEKHGERIDDDSKSLLSED